MNGRRPVPVPRVAWVAAIIVAIALCVPLVWHQVNARPIHRLVDLEVYRAAGHSVRVGHGLYEFRTPPPQLLPFTYPPFPAVLAVPLTFLSFYAAGWVWELASLVLFTWLVAFCFRPVVAEWREWCASRFGPRTAALTTAILAPLLLPAMLWLEPVRATFRFGQVNIIIGALVVADCCLTWTRWPRGMLIGIAAAIKLTPGLFIPYLWLTGRRRAAYLATATFAGCQLLAAAVAPGEAKKYWTDALFHSERLGDNKVTANVAIRGALLRLKLPSTALSVLLAVLVISVLIVGMSRALLASRAGAELAGVVLVGLTSVAISPVSWDHHLIWLVPAFAVLLADPVGTRRLLSAAGLAVVFYSRLPWWAAGLAKRSSGVAQEFWRIGDISFTIVTVMVILALPLKSLSQLPRSWPRGGFPEG
ncbi:MAG: glycosyltransferase 87 family protein [Actinomycetota bacterium]